MNTTNDKTHGVPGFWQKWRSVFSKLFKRKETWACAGGNSSAGGTAEAKTTQIKATA